MWKSLYRFNMKRVHDILIKHSYVRPIYTPWFLHQEKASFLVCIYGEHFVYCANGDCDPATLTLMEEVKNQPLDGIVNIDMGIL